MRKGFSVCANAWRCHALLPRKFRFSATFKRRFATLFNFDTFAEYCQVSPARNGEPASATTAVFFESAGRLATSADGAIPLDSAAPPSLGSSGIAAGRGAVTGTAADARETSLRWCICHATAPPAKNAIPIKANVILLLISYA